MNHIGRIFNRSWNCEVRGIMPVLWRVLHPTSWMEYDEMEATVCLSPTQGTGYELGISVVAIAFYL